MEKILTPRGIEDVDEVIDVETPPKPKPEKFTPPEKRRAIDGWNNSPQVKQNGIIAVSTLQVWIIIGIVGILALTIIIMSIWFNVSFNNKEFNPSVTNDINVEPAQTTIPIENNYQHEITTINNITVIIPEEIIIKFQNQTG